MLLIDAFERASLFHAAYFLRFIYFACRFRVTLLLLLIAGAA